MNTEVATILVMIIIVFLLILIIVSNIKELYDPMLDEVYDKQLGRNCLVLWYNKVTDKEVKREYKILLKL